MSSRKLTWLHLSDIHRCSSRDGGGSEIVLRRLLEDLENLRNREGLSPDLVFMTGDLAFGQIPETPLAEQLEEGWTWLEKVLALYDLQARDVFLVPGNHDVDRGKVKKKDQHWLRTLAKDCDHGEVRQLLHDGGADWRDYMRRLSDFELFVAERCPHLKDDEGRCLYSVVREMRGLRVGVAGFNSAWSCGTDDDKGNIWLCAWQLEELTAKLLDAHLRISLVHHPLSWLVESADTTFKATLQSEFHVFLHGHEHQSWVETPQSKHLIIAAGAVSAEPDADLGYNLVQFDLAEGEGEIWLRTFDRRVNRWKPDMVPGKTNEHGVWPVSPPWLGRDEQPRFQPRKAEEAPLESLYRLKTELDREIIKRKVKRDPWKQVKRVKENFKAALANADISDLGSIRAFEVAARDYRAVGSAAAPAVLANANEDIARALKELHGKSDSQPQPQHREFLENLYALGREVERDIIGRLSPRGQMMRAKENYEAAKEKLDLGELGSIRAFEDAARDYWDVAVSYEATLREHGSYTTVIVDQVIETITRDLQEADITTAIISWPPQV